MLVAGATFNLKTHVATASGLMPSKE